MLEGLRWLQPKGSETRIGGFELLLKDSGTQTEGFELPPKGSEADCLEFGTS